MDEKLQSGAQALEEELTAPLDASVEAAEAAAQQAETAAEAAAAEAAEEAEAAAVEAADAAGAAADEAADAAGAAADEAADAAEAAADEAAEAAEAAGTEAADEAGEALSPEAAFAEAMMADRRPAEDLPIEELPLAEKPERSAKAPMSTGKKIAIAVAAIAILAGLLALTIHLTRSKSAESADAAASGELTADEVGEHSRVDMDEMMKHGPFAYTDESLAEKYNAQIAARVGEHELTGGLLQIFYWSMVYQDLNENADYLSYRGPDTTRPFAEQKYGQNVNWEQHYLQTALDYYLQNVALYDEAVKSGTQLSAETQQMLDSLPANMADQATQYGFDSVEDYLAQSFGPNVTMDDYLEYYRLSSLAFTHATKMQQDITVDADEISAFYDKHAEEYAAQGVEKTDQNVVNVRHILIIPEKDTDADGDGTNEESSQAAWADAEQRINEIYEQWKADPTEDNFAALAGTETADPGSAENGGLYEGVYPGQMVDTFNDWCFDPARAPGDTGIVRTEYGYHLMYFSSEGDRPYWQTVAEEECKYEQFNKLIDDLFSKYEIKPDYENLHLFDIISRSAAQNAAAQADTAAAAGEDAAAQADTAAAAGEEAP